jgi:hypothetical protein
MVVNNYVNAMDRDFYAKTSETPNSTNDVGVGVEDVG